MKKVSIIIPTYNEAKNLPILFEEIDALIDKDKIDAEFIVVDDNSPDGTAEVANKLSGKYPVKVLKRPGKLGLGSAVIDGFNFSNREILGVMDGDMSHDPIILNDLILSLDEQDITIGSRFKDGSVVEEPQLWRRVVSGAGIRMAKLLTGVDDSLSGYFFLKRDVIKDIELKTIGYKILLEILVKGNYASVKEFPYTFRMRKYSTSKLNAKEFLMFLGQLASYSIYKAVNNKSNG